MAAAIRPTLGDGAEPVAAMFGRARDAVPSLPFDTFLDLLVILYALGLLDDVSSPR